MPYVPIHDRPPYFGNLPSPPGQYDSSTPRYASPDLGPVAALPLEMSSGERDTGAGRGYYTGGSDGEGSDDYEEEASRGIEPRPAVATLQAYPAPGRKPELSSSTSSRKRSHPEGGDGNESDGSGDTGSRSPEASEVKSAHQARSTAAYLPTARSYEPTSTKKIRLEGAAKETGRTGGGAAGDHQNGHINAVAGPSSSRAPTTSTSQHAPPAQARPRDRYIHGSIFHMTARNPVTRTIGDWLLMQCRGRQDIEIEVKLGQIISPSHPGQRGRRVHMPALTELILPSDYEVGTFRSDMSQSQHASLNRLLNEAVIGSDPRKFRPDPSNPSARPPHPIKFFRQKQIDEFYYSHGKKTRVSRNTHTGEVLACIVKTKVADQNVANCFELLDFRVSVSTEEPCEMPTGHPNMTREKDRACYRHQLVQVDLTYVKQVMSDGVLHESYELEIEVVDAPGLIAEGMKEERGEPNQYDEMITSILDSARILIRNVGR